jgi:hypothetical protein
VFQYKRRDVFSERSKVLSRLKSELTGAAEKISGEAPSSYTLFTNVHLTTTQSEALRKAIQGRTNVSVEVCGAARICAMLNDLPHIRAAYFGTLRYEAWQDAWDRTRQVSSAGTHVELTGRDAELARLRGLLEDSAVRVILVHGPHGVGKDRLIVEATRENQRGVVLAIADDAPSGAELREIADANRAAILIVRDVDSERLSDLIPQALAQSGVKLVCSIPTLANTNLPNFGFDQRVKQFPLERLDNASAQALLEKTGVWFDWGLLTWIVEKAGGLPEVLLAAASLRGELRDKVKDFYSEVGRQFSRRLENELGAQAVAATQAVSLLAGLTEQDLEIVCNVMNLRVAEVRAQFPDLERSGWLFRRGPFWEVAPPIFAQFLAGRALACDFSKLDVLLVRLDAQARLRLFRRLTEVQATPDLREFWKDALTGLVGSPESISASIHLLPMFAEVAPRETLDCLRNLQPERDSGWLHATLARLLSSRETAAGALRLILKLGSPSEQSPEATLRSATFASMFTESFAAVHPQVAASFAERLAILRDLFQTGSESQQALAVEAAKKCADTFCVGFVQHSAGFMPADASPGSTWEEILDYGVAVLDLLGEIGSKPSGDAPRLARTAAAHVAAAIGAPRPDAALRAFRRCLGWLQERRTGLEPSELALLIQRPPAEWPESLLQGVAQIVQELDHLSFPQRVQRWSQDMVALEESNRKLQALAREAVANPDKLTPPLLDWLAARGLAFAFHLGQRDGNRHFLSDLEARAKSETGAGMLGAYCQGWAATDPLGFSSYLGSIEDKGLCAEALLYAAKYAQAGDQNAFSVIMRVITSKSIDPIGVTLSLMASAWFVGASESMLLEMASVAAGPAVENWEAIYLIALWNGESRSLTAPLRELAWKCFESNPRGAMEQRSWLDYARNELVTQLASTDPERGLLLLTRLMDGDPSRLGDTRTLPKDRLWKALLHVSPRRTQEVVLASIRRGYRGLLRSLGLDQEGDAGTILEIALQNARCAKHVAESLCFSSPGYWAITLPLAVRFSRGAELLAALSGSASAIRGLGGPAKAYERRAAEVERVLAASSTPPEAQPWLRWLAAELRRGMGHEVVWDYGRDASDLTRFVEDKNAPERTWAIGRILKHAEWRDVQKLLSVQDIKDALPLLDLPEPKRRALESAVEYWERQSA